MRKKIRLLNFIALLSIVLVSFGCAKASKNVGTPQSVTPSITTTPAAVTPTPLVITTTPPGVVLAIVPPMELKNLEKNALRVIMDADSRSWKDGKKRYKLMKNEVSALAPKLTKAGVNADIVNNITSLVNKLDTYITSKASYETKLNANELTRYIADSMVVFKGTVPPDIIRLDYYLRYIQYSLEKSDWTNALNYGNLASTMWKNLKVQITANSKIINKMDKAMSALDISIKSKNKTTTLKDTRKCLLASGLITKYFDAKPKAKRP